jgi:hypothetical protein
MNSAENLGRHISQPRRAAKPTTVPAPPPSSHMLLHIPWPSPPSSLHRLSSRHHPLLLLHPRSREARQRPSSPPRLYSSPIGARRGGSRSAPSGAELDEVAAEESSSQCPVVGRSARVGSPAELPCLRRRATRPPGEGEVGTPLPTELGRRGGSALWASSIELGGDRERDWGGRGDRGRVLRPLRRLGERGVRLHGEGRRGAGATRGWLGPGGGSTACRLARG